VAQIAVSSNDINDSFYLNSTTNGVLSPTYFVQGFTFDQTTNGTTVSLLNSVNLTTQGNISFVTTGAFANAISFNGGSARATMSTSITLPNNSFSISWWMNKSTTTYQCIFANTLGATSGHIEIGKTLNKLRFETKTNQQTDYSTINTGINTADGQWHHYVLTSGATRFDAYVDGVNSSSLPAIVDVTSATQEYRYIGAAQGTTTFIYGQTYIGYIDEIRAFSTELSSSEIIKLYNFDVVSGNIGAPIIENRKTSTTTTTITINI
jgi:hypothetical protein